MRMFEKPIPGQSLTTPPKSMPYERPPEINDPEEALEMHLLRLSEPERTEALMDTLETGIDIVTLTEGYLRSAVANGIHSVDISLMVAPAIHKFIKSTADKLGVDYEEGLVDEEEQKTQKRTIEFAKAKNKLSKKNRNTQEEKRDETMVQETPEGPSDTPSSGFMKRRSR